MEAVTKTLKWQDIEPNKGQIKGLPKNPRFIKDNRFNDLKRSIQEAPEMLRLRPLIVVEHEGKYVIIGGNMRYKAGRSLSVGEFPCVILPESTPVEKLREYTIKDNIAFGQNDLEAMKFEWDATELANWGEILPTDFVPEVVEDDPAKQWRESSKDERRADQQEKRLAWGRAEDFKEATCNLKPDQSLIYKDGSYYLASFRKTAEGVPFTQLKCPQNVELFTSQALDIIRGALLQSGEVRDWAVICAPARRHSDGFNFAEAISRKIAEALSIKDYTGSIKAVGSDRIHPVFELTEPVTETNVILYDDIMTTGSTLTACRKLLRGKNVLSVVGINNR